MSPPPVLEELDEAECLRLITPGGIGRIAYSGRYGPTVLPVNYKLHQGSIVFRTAQDSPTDEDLRTGIAHAEYKVAFEIDDVDSAAREGWSVLIQGPLHHVESGAERASAMEAGVEPWPGGDRELFLRITPSRITGRRIRRAREAAPGAGRCRLAFEVVLEAGPDGLMAAAAPPDTAASARLTASPAGAIRRSGPCAPGTTRQQSA